GLDLLGLVSDGLAIAGVHRFDKSPQVLGQVERDRVALSQEGPGAAAVFRRCLALPADTDRIGPPRFLRGPGLDADPVLPRRDEVILVDFTFRASMHVMRPGGATLPPWPGFPPPYPPAVEPHESLRPAAPAATPAACRRGSGDAVASPRASRSGLP